VLGDIDPGDAEKIAEDIGSRAVACALDVRRSAIGSRLCSWP